MIEITRIAKAAGMIHGAASNDGRSLVPTHPVPTCSIHSMGRICRDPTLRRNRAVALKPVKTAGFMEFA
jgi:hypothetical protein